MDDKLRMVGECHKAFGLKDFDKKATLVNEEHNELEELYYILHDLAEQTKNLPKAVYKSSMFVRVQLMIEELGEVIEAFSHGTDAEILKELCDLEYTVLGTISHLGYSGVYDEAFKRIHESNMSKLDWAGKPIISEFGRIIKSDKYKPADLRDLVK
jgi:predicted HAD superfamily Cof-like phosphohydrolase